MFHVRAELKWVCKHNNSLLGATKAENVITCLATFWPLKKSSVPWIGTIRWYCCGFRLATSPSCPTSCNYDNERGFHWKLGSIVKLQQVRRVSCNAIPMCAPCCPLASAQNTINSLQYQLLYNGGDNIRATASISVSFACNWPTLYTNFRGSTYRTFEFVSLLCNQSSNHQHII